MNPQNVAPTESPDTSAVPEPSSYALMIIGLIGLVVFRRKQRAQQAA
ncbi:MAG: PEP-CTERM sorting domain-containing protein [Lentisphaeraceae bacterium]|nr:PEP-CTERM sorting domain-containing protein [Lentisphaeraceae bacterium]